MKREKKNEIIQKRMFNNSLNDHDIAREVSYSDSFLKPRWNVWYRAVNQ